VVAKFSGSSARRSKHASIDVTGKCVPVPRWSLSRRLLSVRNAIAWLFGAGTILGMSMRGVWRAGAWSPAVDLYETDEALILKAELAGFSEADVNVEIKDRTLLLQGSRPRECEVTEERYHCMEWASGAFQRYFLLPALVDQENVSVSYNDGVFKLRLPKARHTTLGQHHDEVTRQSS
jgi:HSP20 family protein